MKTDTQTANEKARPADRTLEILKKYFPQCFLKPETDKNGNVIKEHFDTEKLSALLNDNVDITKEGFTLNFLGKSYARYQANLESETVIVPDAENSKTESKNIYLVGDNLDALQHLRHSYSEKIKCIYIDPPYNTGKDDFVYNDKFGFTAKELVEKLDIDEDEAERIVEMQGKCTHSAWLTFMYPRLALARDLLRDDGVIFISIDDNEQANLKRLCDEVFGEGNFVGCISRATGTTTGQDANKIGSSIDYCLVYRKSENFELFGIPLDENDLLRFTEKDEKGNYSTLQLRKTGNADRQEDRPNMFYAVKAPDNTNVYPFGPTGYLSRWRVAKSSYENLVSNNMIIWKKEKLDSPFKVDNYQQSEWKPYVKYYSEGRTKQISNLLDNIEGNKKASIVVKNLFGVKDIFTNPKPVELLTVLMTISNTKDSDIILDFFSGSATTAHAVMQLNAQDGGNRKFIMVQLDEKVKKDSEAEKAGYHTIDEIGRERIRRAAAKIKSENPDTKADLGFKTYYLKSMPQNTLDKIKTFNPKELFSSDGDIVKSLGEETLLQTWQIKDGFGFDCIQQKIDIEGYTAYLLENEEIGNYLYLLTQMSKNSIKELIRRIEAKELNPSKVFVYGYSFDFDSLTSLTKNLEMLKNREKIDAIIRY